jgi:hypothetical protein
VITSAPVPPDIAFKLRIAAEVEDQRAVVRDIAENIAARAPTGERNKITEHFIHTLQSVRATK